MLIVDIAWALLAINFFLLFLFEAPLIIQVIPLLLFLWLQINIFLLIIFAFGGIDWLIKFCRERRDRDYLIKEENIEKVHVNAKNKLIMGFKNVKWILKKVAGYIYRKKSEVRIEETYGICDSSIIFCYINK